MAAAVQDEAAAEQLETAVGIDGLRLCRGVENDTADRKFTNPRLFMLRAVLLEMSVAMMSSAKVENADGRPSLAKVTG
ncbi:MAG: hypothetical protein ACKVOI_10175 [Dongiaceae bacterium]